MLAISPRVYLLAAAAVSFLVIAVALALEHWAGYAPCPLCLEQRQPYYVGVPLFLVLALGIPNRAWKGYQTPAGAFLMALVFAKGALIGGYQAGAEWGFWEGPVSCASAVLGRDLDGPGLLALVKETAHVSCTVPALRILGISLAGWNVLASVAVASIALLSAWTSLPRSVAAESTAAFDNP